MLYQLTELSYPGFHYQNTIPPGGLVVISIEVPPGGSVQLTMNQMVRDPLHPSQDYSIRAWLSPIRGGNPVPDAASMWTLTALQKRIVYAYDATANLGPFDGICLDVLPGNYWINVLNLVNETNSFFLELFPSFSN